MVREAIPCSFPGSVGRSGVLHTVGRMHTHHGLTYILPTTVCEHEAHIWSMASPSAICAPPRLCDRAGTRSRLCEVRPTEWSCGGRHLRRAGYKTGSSRWRRKKVNGCVSSSPTRRSICSRPGSHLQCTQPHAWLGKRKPNTTLCDPS